MITQAEIDELEWSINELARRTGRRKFYSRFPETGDCRRELYAKHMELFDAGREYRERAFMAANRVGKTESGAYETTCHLTGLYPSWWTGRVFNHPVDAWGAGKTNETTRDIVQHSLFGGVEWAGTVRGFDGTGMVPGDLICPLSSWRQGVTDLADTVKVRHVTGGWSSIGLKSYQQGRGSFEGTARHLIWLDEEPPSDVYGECLIRTATTSGIILTTFTPLEGLTEVAMSFMPGDMRPGS